MSGVDVAESPGQSPSRTLLPAFQQISTADTRDGRRQPMANADPQVRPCWNRYAVKWATIVSLSCLLIGFDVAVLGEPMLLIKKDKRVSSKEVEQQVGYLHLWSLVGALALGWLSDVIGRRHTIGWTGGFFVFGTLLIGLFPNNAVLMSGRAITQVCVGFAPMVATNYIAELAPAPCRGFLSTFPELFISFGKFLGNGFNYIAAGLDPIFGSFALFSIGVIISIVFTFGVGELPESPRWLVLKGHDSEAMRVLTMTSSSQVEAERRLADIVEVNRESTGEGARWDLCRPNKIVWHMLLCAGGVQFFQQACGVDMLILYGPSFFEEAGVTSYNGKLLCTMAIHLVKSVAMLVPTFFLDKVGRVWLLLRSIVGMGISLLILGACLLEIDQNDKPKWAVGTTIPSLLFSVGFHSMGLGPVASVYCAEIFQLRQRAIGYAIGIVTNQVVSGLLAISFPHLYGLISLGGTVFLFTAFAIVAWLFVRLVLPETNGKNLEESWREFGQLFAWRRSEATTGEIALQRNSARRQH